MKIIKILFGFMFAIWMAGAVVMWFYFLISDKKNCIEEEGFWKGWLWCESESFTRGGAAAEEISLLFRSAIWPIYLFSHAEESPVPERHVESGHSNSEFEFRNSSVAILYDCYLASLKLGKDSDRESFAYGISVIRKMDNTADKAHDDNIAHAGMFLNKMERDIDNGIELFYGDACTKPAENIGKLKRDGII